MQLLLMPFLTDNCKPWMTWPTPKNYLTYNSFLLTKHGLLSDKSAALFISHNKDNRIFCGSHNTATTILYYSFHKLPDYDNDCLLLFLSFFLVRWDIPTVVLMDYWETSVIVKISRDIHSLDKTHRLLFSTATMMTLKLLIPLDQNLRSTKYW